MKAHVGSTISFDPGACCGRQDFEYRSGGTKRKGTLIEPWMVQRCIYCKRAFRVVAFCKLAGDEDATGRQYRHRASKEKKFATPSTGVEIKVGRKDRT